MAKIADTPPKDDDPHHAMPSDVARTIRLRVFRNGREVGVDHFRLNAADGYIALAAASGVAGQGGDAAGQRPLPVPSQSYDDLTRRDRNHAGDEPQLGTLLATLGYGLPPAHIRRFLDWSHNRNQQVGIRKPHPEDLSRISSRSAAAPGATPTLRWPDVARSVVDLLRVIAAFEELPATVQPGEVTLDQTHDFAAPPLTDPARALVSGSAVAKDLHDIAERTAAGFRDLSPTLQDPARWHIWKAQWDDILDKTDLGAMERFLDHQPALDAAAAAPEAYSVAGLGGAWTRLTLTTQIGGTPDVHTATIPAGVFLADEGFAAFGSGAEATATALTEGYHAFRVIADIAGLEAEARTIATREIAAQANRDRLILSAQFALPATGKKADESDPLTFFAPFDLSDCHSLEPTRKVAEGALLVTAPKPMPHGDETEDVTDIYVFEDDASLEANRADLVNDQTANLRRNIIALSAVTFIAGQMYAAPDLGALKKISQFVDRDLRKVAAIAAGGFLAVLLSSMTLGLPVLIATAAVLTVGAKRWVDRKYHQNPAKILRSREYTAIMKGDLSDAELAAVKAKHTDVEGVEAKLYSGKQTKAMQAGPLDFATYCTMNESDIGDLVRRSVVHFRRAETKWEEAQVDDSHDQARRLGKALHHVEKGWRYLSPVVLFYGMVWSDNLRAKEGWRRQSPRASLFLMKEFLEIYDNEIEDWKDREAAKKTMTRLIQPLYANAVKPFIITRKLGAAKRAIKNTRPWKFIFRIGATPVDVSGDFKRQLEVFLDNAYGPVGTTPAGSQGPNWRQDIGTIGGPELFAEWQRRGGMLEPASAIAKGQGRVGGAHRRRPETFELVRALQSDGLDILGGQVYARLKLYHGAVDAIRSESFNEHRKDTPVMAKLRRTLGLDWDFRTGWSEADDPGFFKSMRHDWRNLWFKSSKKEKAMDVVFAAGEATAGFWAQLGFGQLDSYMGLPINDDSDSLFKVIGDETRRNDKAKDAAYRGLISKGIWVAQLMSKNAADAAVTARRTYVAEPSQLLTGANRARSAAGIMAANSVVPEVDLRDVKSKELKHLATYFGAGLVKRIGDDGKIARDALEQFSKIAPKGFLDDPEYLGVLDKIERKLSWKDRLDLFALRVKPLAEYYATMDRLDADLNDLLIFLEMERKFAIELERKIFKDLNILNQYNQFHDNSSVPNGDPSDGEGQAPMPNLDLVVPRSHVGSDPVVPGTVGWIEDSDDHSHDYGDDEHKHDDGEDEIVPLLPGQMGRKPR